MRRGVWHQFGSNSQLLALEQMEHGVGVGVIISPKDLTLENAAKHSVRYREVGADVLFDPQFYVPEFQNTNLQSYGMNACRVSVTQLRQLSDSHASALATALEHTSRTLQVSALISPALCYEAGRPDIVNLNRELFAMARGVGDALGIPTYATVAFGQSVTNSDRTMGAALSAATALLADGWYYAFEFPQVRVPDDEQRVFRCCASGLTLAYTGKPVLHAFAGPMGLLSMGFGATGAGVGHWQNLWHFACSHWQQTGDQGGGGKAPPRYFSGPMWGTIVYPDETANLPMDLRRRIFSDSPFDTNVRANVAWDRWTANKHLVYTIGSTVASIADEQDAVACAHAAIVRLQGSLDLQHAILPRFGRDGLRDNTTAYQGNWKTAVSRLLTERRDDYDYLALLG